jgi:hypothetical protein
MQQINPSVVEHARDPVSLIIERELAEIAEESQIETELNPSANIDVQLRFDNVVVQGETRDIALIRLASALLIEERFRVRLVEVLGPRST